MIVQRDVVRFEKGSVLQKEMLESLYNYPRVICESFYSNYSDGILYGLECIEEDEQRHRITAGALKYKGNIYISSESVVLEEMSDYQNLTDSQMYYLCFKERQVESTYSRDVYNLDLSFEIAPNDNMFCYKYLKYQLNRISILDNVEICGLYSVAEPDSFGIPVTIIKNEIMPVLLKKDNKHPLDFIIMNSVYEHKALSYDFVNMYLSETDNELNTEFNDLINNRSPKRVREFVNAFKKSAEKLKMSSTVIMSSNEPLQSNKKEERSHGRML